MTTEPKDGCPRCTRRDNEPRTWDETTGKATYRCRACGHAWATWWEHPAATDPPALLGDLVDGFLADITVPPNPNQRKDHP
jgi:transcription elongation factor Elf1